LYIPLPVLSRSMATDCFELLAVPRQHQCSLLVCNPKYTISGLVDGSRVCILITSSDEPLTSEIAVRNVMLFALDAKKELHTSVFFWTSCDYNFRFGCTVLPLVPMNYVLDLDNTGIAVGIAFLSCPSITIV